MPLMIVPVISWFMAKLTTNWKALLTSIVDVRLERKKSEKFIVKPKCNVVMGCKVQALFSDSFV